VAALCGVLLKVDSISSGMMDKIKLSCFIAIVRTYVSKTLADRTRLLRRNGGFAAKV